MKNGLLRIALAIAMFIAFSNGDNINKNSKMSDFNWVVIVKDKKFYPPMNIPLSIDMRAINTSGDIEGKYTGTAVIGFSFQDGDFSASASTKSNSLNFSVVPALASLVKGKKPVMATNFVGEGEMISTKATGMVKTSEGMSQATHTASVVEKIHVIITGTQVKLVIDFKQGPITYYGHIIGEGKVTANKNSRPSNAKKIKIKDEDKLTPLVPAEDDVLAPLVPKGK